MNYLILAFVILLSACSSVKEKVTSKIDIASVEYCYETSPIIKAALKAELIKLGVVLPVDYCTAYGVLK